MDRRIRAKKDVKGENIRVTKVSESHDFPCLLRDMLYKRRILLFQMKKKKTDI